MRTIENWKTELLAIQISLRRKEKENYKALLALSIMKRDLILGKL